MTRKIILLAIISFISIGLYGQQEINKGKIFTSNGILIGFINTSTYDETPQSFQFSTIEAGPFNSISIADITKVEYENGTLFEKKEVHIKIVSKDYLNRSKEDYIGGDSINGLVMVQRLLSSKLSLFVLRDKHTFLHFFYTEDENSASLSELIFHPFVTDKSVIKKDAAFKNQLSFLQSKFGCSTLNSSAIENGEYEIRSLISIFQKINSCTGTPVVLNYTKKTTKLQVGFEVLGGIQLFINNSQTAGKITPIIGGSLSFGNGRNKKSISLFWDLTAMPFNGSITTLDGNNKTLETYHTVLLQTGPRVRVYVSNTKVLPYFEGSFSFPFSTNLTYTTSKYTNGILVSTEKVTPKRNFLYGFGPIGFGLSYKKSAFSLLCQRSLGTVFTDGKKPFAVQVVYHYTIK